MPLLLSIETASDVCSVVLSNDQELIGIRESERKNSHAEVVTVFIDELFRENNLGKSQLDAVVVSKGPGSYTGLRIGVSTAKGLCYALNIPLIAINTLESMAAEILLKTPHKNLDNYLFCPMLDARRMEVYSALFDPSGNQIQETLAEIIDENSYANFLENNKVIFFGNGAEKCKGVIKNINAIFIDNIRPSAEYLVRPALEKFKKGKFEDVAYFEPFYLKDFVAGIPKVKGLK